MNYVVIYFFFVALLTIASEIHFEQVQAVSPSKTGAQLFHGLSLIIITSMLLNGCHYDWTPEYESRK